MGRRSWWIAGSIATCAVVLALIIIGYKYNWGWTGFGPETSEPKQHAKTLWDWLQLLAALLIPVVIAVFSWRYTRQQSQTENAIASDNLREAALQAYLDKMSELLLEKNLRSSEQGDEVRNVARARTLTVLSQLDGKRKGNLIQFLYESQLISVIDLSGADLSGANLQAAHLTTAKLNHANLSNANLRYANLEFANLSVANLRKVDLRDTCLNQTDISYADLSDADLRNADLTKVQITKANLSNVNLHGATIDEGTLYIAKTYAILSHTNLDDAIIKKEEKVEQMKPSTQDTSPNSAFH
jgi:uncharacterized protein YjbI with pentapeptide repeats